MILWTKFAPKKYFESKTDTFNTTIEFCTFELVLAPNFSLNWQFWFLDQICPKRKFTVSNRKIKQHHSNLYIRVSLNAKFQLKFTILIFLTKFGQKGISSRKQEKRKWPLNFYIWQHICPGLARTKCKFYGIF